MQLFEIGFNFQAYLLNGAMSLGTGSLGTVTLGTTFLATLGTEDIGDRGHSGRHSYKMISLQNDLYDRA